jgi:serine/threonine-protein kinase
VSESSQKDDKPASESAAQRAQKLVGFVISGRYRVVDVLAVGGMGVVYRGQHVHMRKRVAIKVLLPETKGLPNLVARFEREAVVGAHLTHPNIASATDFGKLDDGSYFLILEYARGITLSEIIKQGPMDPLRAARIARQLAAALDAAHRMGVIHRDMKPRNVMVDVERGDFVKLIDFGLAKAPADGLPDEHKDDDDYDDDEGLENRELTTVGVVFGTVAYMSPEAALGMVMVDHRSDLYALGIMFYEMLAGMHPYQATDPVELFRLQRMVMPPSISVRSPKAKVPPALEALVTKLIEKVPEDRFQSAEEFIEALDDLMPEAAVVPADRTSGANAGLTPGPSSTRNVRIRTGTTGPISVRGADKPPPSGPSSAPGGDPASARGGAGASGASAVSTTSTATTTSIQASTFGQPGGRAAVPVVAVRQRREGTGALGWTLRVLAVAVLLAAGGFFWWKNRVGAAGDPPKPAAPDAVKTAAPPEADPPASTNGATPQPPGAPQGAVAPAGAASSGAAAATGPALATRVQEAADAKQWDAGADALLDLAKVDPAAFKTREVKSAAASIATGAALAGGERADKVFQLLANDLGEDGLEILYAVAGDDGRDPVTEPAKRALDLLGEKEVLDRASPALQVAVEIRRAPCMKKAFIFKKAKIHADQRTLDVLEVLRSHTCNKKRGECCFTGNNLVEDTVRTIQARLKSSP